MPNLFDLFSPWELIAFVVVAIALVWGIYEVVSRYFREVDQEASERMTEMRREADLFFAIFPAAGPYKRSP